MKIISFIGRALRSVWRFSTRMVTICLISSLVLFGVTIFMPDNALKAIEIVRSIFI